MAGRPVARSSMKRTLSAVVALGAGLLLAGLAGAPAGAATAGAAALDNRSVTTYEPSTENIANPERGFYHSTETHYRADGSGYTPFKLDTLRKWRDQEHITQVLRVFYLEKFAGTDRIDPAYLDLLRADFATARAAGLKVIVRFAYAQPKDDFPYLPPYGDAPRERVLKHISQLAPVLRANTDVIATVQAGFIGLWGEGYYTDYFAADPSNPGVVTSRDWANRRAVFSALLRALPKTRTIDVRTMQMKQKTLDRPSGTEGALTAEEAFSGSPASRIGHHNDCFLASADDFGTFLSDPITLDQEYLAQETQFVPIGGETCGVDAPRSEWDSAKAEMTRYHYSYLNTDYNHSVLDSWGDNIEEARQRLGYRFRLTEGEFTNAVRPGHSFDVDLTLHNDGWASPYNPRSVELILAGEHKSYTVEVPSDPRRWAAGTDAEISAKVCANVPPGQYRLMLNLPDPESRLHSQNAMPGGTASYNSAYAIQLANDGVWQPETGYNDLGQTLVVGPHETSTSNCGGTLHPHPTKR
jgi:hypothetical protein